MAKGEDLMSGNLSGYQIGEFFKRLPVKTKINGSSGSIMDNIAEGFGRNGTVEFISFLHISIGSAKETKSQYIEFTIEITFLKTNRLS